MLTLRQIAEHLDMSVTAARSRCAALGIDRSTASLDSIRIAYIRDLRGAAAGRGGDDGQALVRERARLAAAQSERVERENAVAKRQLAPIHIITTILATVSRRVAAHLEAIPGRLRLRLPHLSVSDLKAVEDEIVKARNLAAKVTILEEDITP